MTPARRSDRQPSRRAVLAAGMGLGAAGLLGACGDTSGQAGAPSPASPRTPAPTTAPPDPTPLLPVVQDWAPLPGEVEPGCKTAAVEAVRAALTVTPGSPRPRLPEPLQPLAALVPDGPTLVDVLYPQYGGLTKDVRTASVMLNADLLTLSPVPALGPDTEHEDGTGVLRVAMSLDVRLSRATDGPWTVTQVLVPEARGATSPLRDDVVALLDNDRVDLPGWARIDLAAGIVQPRLVALLATLSEQWRIGVHVLDSGHPTHIFGTDRVSNHTRGRAVDIWAIDDIPVIDQENSDWREMMLAAVAAGAESAGGPERPAPGTPGRPYFTDPVHQDHLHLAFLPEGAAATTAPAPQGG